MKRLAFILMLFILSCSNPVENNETEIFTTTYELLYDRHYDHDTQFMSSNKISGNGIIHSVNFIPYNFDQDVEFGFFITINQYDTLYFLQKIDTQATEKVILVLNKKFNGVINVHIFRYETYKQINFRCKITYSYL